MVLISVKASIGAQEEVKAYEYMDNNDVYIQCKELSNEYPDLVTWKSAQELYGLPTAGSMEECPLEGGGCHNWILTIFDSLANSHPVIQERIPDVLITAGFYGDSKLGPTIVMELASLLLEVTHCESLPRNRRHRQNQNQKQQHNNAVTQNDVLADPSEESMEEESWEEQVREADDCRQALDKRGIYSSHRRWLSRLVSTRRIILVPVVNPLAFSLNQPHELPQTNVIFDFPFSMSNDETNTTTTNNNNCMRTIAARTINEIFKSHILQSTITFHSGTNEHDETYTNHQPFIAYEWGSPLYKLPNSNNANNPVTFYAAPDALAQQHLATVLRSYAGDIPSTTSYYDVGTIHDFINPVKANRMEDWSYAASWDTKHVPPFCQPDTYDGYDANKTTYSVSELRSSTMMVQTSMEKEPPIHTLGTNQDLFTPHGNGNGHVSRNIRLALSSIDLVEPYVTFLNVADTINIGDAFYPQSPKPMDQKECIEQTRVISIPENIEDNFQIQWTVGGSLFVDSTALMYGSWEDLDKDIFNCIHQPTKDELDTFFDLVRASNEDYPNSSGSSQKRKRVFFTKSSGPGTTLWKSRSAEYATADVKSMITSDTVFSTTDLDLSQFREGERIAVYAVARVDQYFFNMDDAPNNNNNNNNIVRDHLAPQSHLVNARINPEWNHRDNGKVVQGRLDWFSIPITLRIGPPDSPIEEIISNGEDPSYYKQYDQEQQLNKILKGLFIGVACAIFITVCIFVREKSDGNDIFSIWSEQRSIMASAIPDDEYEPDIILEDEHDRRSNIRRIELS